MVFRRVKQTKLGGTTAPPEERGNCYPACLASLIGTVELEDIPNFFASDEPVLDQWNAVTDWLHSKGLSQMTFNWSEFKEHLPNYRRTLKDSLLVFSGKSPRGDYSHAVVGRLTDTGWELVHDPHPSDQGIVGEPEFVDIMLAITRYT